MFHPEKRNGIAVLGPNGAGKSTLLKAIVGLVPRIVGSIVFRGLQVVGKPTPEVIRLGIGFAGQGHPVFTGLTVRENLEVACSQLPRSQRLVRAAEVQGMFPELTPQSLLMAEHLSGGEQQMLSLARAITPQPSLLLLDEPSLGVSRDRAEELFGVLRLLKDGASLVLVEQNVTLALAHSDHVLVLRSGGVVYFGDSKAVSRKDVVEMMFGTSCDQPTSR